MDADRRILRDGSIAVSDGRIVAVGPTAEVAPEIKASEIRDMKGALIHPGLVDAHVHPTLQLVRGVLPDFYDEERLVREYGPPSAAEKTEEEEYSSVLLASMEMVHNGTTTFADTGSSKYLSGTVAVPSPSMYANCQTTSSSSSKKRPLRTFFRVFLGQYSCFQFFMSTLRSPTLSPFKAWGKNP